MNMKSQSGMCGKLFAIHYSEFIFDEKMMMYVCVFVQCANLTSVASIESG